MQWEKEKYGGCKDIRELDKERVNGRSVGDL